MKHFNRRVFIRCSSQAAVGGAFARLGLMSALAAPASGYKALVCIFQNGGNDGHSTVIPITTTKNSYQDYAVNRPDLIFAPNASAAATTLAQTLINPLSAPNDTYALHPQLKDMAALFRARKVAVLINAGNLVSPMTQAIYSQNYNGGPAFSSIPSSLFSHSNQILQWQAAVPNDGYTTGWAGRMVDQNFNSPPPAYPLNIASSDGILFGLGQNALPTTVPYNYQPNAAVYAINGVTLPGCNPPTSGPACALGQLLTFDNGLRLVQAANDIARRGIDQNDLLSDALTDIPLPTATPWTATGYLADQLKMVARIIWASSGLAGSGAAPTRQIFFVSHGTYDSHANQRAEYGGQDPLLKELNDAMRTFQTAMEYLSLQNQVTTFTNSEFGRTLQQSGVGSSAGTDHAWGGHQLIMGGAVKGGDFYGKTGSPYDLFPRLVIGGPDDTFPLPSNANQPVPRGVIIPSTSVAQYGATLARWFGVPDSNLNAIFANLPNFPSPTYLRDLGFML